MRRVWRTHAFAEPGLELVVAPRRGDVGGHLPLHVRRPQVNLPRTKTGSGSKSVEELAQKAAEPAEGQHQPWVPGAEQREGDRTFEMPTR